MKYKVHHSHYSLNVISKMMWCHNMVLEKHCLNIIYFLQKQLLEVIYKKSVLKNFAKLTGKHLFQNLFFNKVAGLRPATLLKKRLWNRCFPINFAKFLGSPFYRTTPGDCFCPYQLQLMQKPSPRVILEKDYTGNFPMIYKNQTWKHLERKGLARKHLSVQREGVKYF